jgi:hypothetical protein
MWWRSPNQLNAAKIGGSTVVQAVPTFGLGSARSDPTRQITRFDMQSLDVGAGLVGEGHPGAVV